MGFFADYIQSQQFNDWSANQEAEAARNRARLMAILPEGSQNALTAAQGYYDQIPSTGIADYLSNRFRQSQDYFQNQQQLDAERNRNALRDLFVGGR